MFIRAGSRYINTRYINEIRTHSSASNEENATLYLEDGSTCTTFMTWRSLDALSEQIIPAPPGYDAYVESEFDLDDEELSADLEWKPVVAFVYETMTSLLEPITAEDGRLNRYAVRQPNGRVYTSYESFFENADQYRKYLAAEMAKRKAKVAQRVARRAE